MTVIANGTPYPANWFWPMSAGTILMFEIIDTRPLYQIAKEFENAETIEKQSATEGNETYQMTGRVLRIQRTGPSYPEVQISVERTRRT